MLSIIQKETGIYVNESLLQEFEKKIKKEKNFKVQEYFKK